MAAFDIGKLSRKILGKGDGVAEIGAPECFCVQLLGPCADERRSDVAARARAAGRHDGATCRAGRFYGTFIPAWAAKGKPSARNS